VAEALPLGVTVARLALLALAALTALAGVGAVGLTTSMAWLDPTLGGDATLALAVAFTLGLPWLAGAGGAALAAVLLPSREPFGIGLATVFGALAVLSPLFPLGGAILWGLWLDEEGRAFRR
jgi:hypothetical protein